MLDDGIVITRITEQRTYGPDLTADVAMRVEFMVGKHGPFVEKFPKGSYTAATRDYKLNDFAREVR